MTTTPAESPAGHGLDSARRRMFGAFYTPDHAVTHMVGMLTGLNAESQVLEPSGGDGAFVCGLLDQTSVHPRQVTVFDLDPAVAAPVDALGARFECRDSLLSPPVEGGYTHVVGNPPYLNKQSAYLKANKTALGRRYARIGANDTYAMFTVMALEQLTDGGQLVFLISDTFLTLGIHRKLRELLLTETTVNSVTLLPPGLFTDAAVRTAVLNVTRAPARPGHRVEFHDLRASDPGDYTGGTRRHIDQAELAGNPASVLAFSDADRAVLDVIRRCPTKLMTLLDGGLGLHTGDNSRYLRVVDHPGTGPLLNVPAGQRPLPAAAVGAGDRAPWRAYHKRGGQTRWWRPAEHAVSWLPSARAGYGIPATALAGTSPDGCPRRGFIVSGIASRLSARMMTTGALWESNKAFGLFSKDEAARPVELFVAVLNSAWYDRAAHALNHTVSLQTRDLAALPWLPFTDGEEAVLVGLGRAAVAEAASGASGAVSQQEAIDRIVDTAAARVIAGPATGNIAGHTAGHTAGDIAGDIATAA